MPWGKSEEEKAAEAAERQAEEARRQAEAAAAQAERERQAYLDGPVGRAETARQRGDAFYQLELDISTLSGPSSWFGSSDNQITGSGRPDLLGQIEDAGWHLEHVGYVFVETGSTSTARAFSSGEGTVTRGVVQGIYLFRAR